jgi:hypothetical protein
MGSYNTALGAGALAVNNGDENTATGLGALLSNTIGSNNTANGAFALFSNTTGASNLASGSFALFSNTTGDINTAIGLGALQLNVTGFQNTANGAQALYHNTSGDNNTAMGASALYNNDVSDDNTAVGVSALEGNTGRRNTALGSGAGSLLTTGDNNIDIGYNVLGLPGEANTIRIGDTNITTTIIRGISGQTITNGAAVFVAANGQLGTMTSSKRFKEEIKPMSETSETLFSLKPVTFRYTKEIDPARTSQYGLVAEEVEEVNPDLVARDENGKPYSVRYDQVNAMLLNEFLKEHKAFVEQQRTVEELKKQVAVLTIGLQKVSGQLELTNRDRQTALNDR